MIRCTSSSDDDNMDDGSFFWDTPNDAVTDDVSYDDMVDDDDR